MAQQAQITGKVEYREGDGALLRIRKGPVEVSTTDLDATLSWHLACSASSCRTSATSSRSRRGAM